ncbi:MAG: ATP-dependent helicase RecG [Nitrospirae bacterium]|nr:ATP-dependent helicase RecG [Nitrospirota bacterium]
MDKALPEHSIESVKGIGPQRAKLFLRVGIRTVSDALYYLPYRYEDRTELKKISEIRPDGTGTVQGKIVFANDIRTRMRKFRIFEIAIHDGTGFLKAKWFNQPFLQKNFPLGKEVILSGIVKNSGQAALEMDSPEYELVSDDTDSFIHTKRIVPVYRITEGISQKQFRKIMFGMVTEHASGLSDFIPPFIIERNHLPPLSMSIQQLHFPEGGIDLDALNSGTSTYHRRLSFDELFLFELGLAALKRRARLDRGIAFRPEGNLRKALLNVLPFALTDAQKNTLAEIRKDMRSPYPMNRLIQGDVGCGKTVVALLAMFDAIESGYQAALMAPTEILAGQHYINIHGLVKALGLKAELLTAGSKGGHREGIASGETDMVIGTHALIQEGVKFKKLGLAVVDEQHKFGVIQRALLRKKGLTPDVLVMTATPIPRSLALTLYGDMDSSVIDELPPGRRPVVTKLFEADRKEDIYVLLRKEIDNGRQAYVVYPAIEESEKTDLKNAVQGKEGFEKVFPEYRIGLLHGRMSTGEREKVMLSFRQGEIDILVSTTVIEVGVDVPNATIMLVVHAERFGLAQLHQLRGRVGRGADRSLCILVAYKPYGEEARRRLDIMLRSNDGFRIAEEDLAIRGPGEFLGTRQAGIPDLKVANIVRDMKILEKAKAEAFGLTEASPDLGEFPSLKKTVEVFWKGKIDFFKTG